MASLGSFNEWLVQLQPFLPQILAMLLVASGIVIAVVVWLVRRAGCRGQAVGQSSGMGRATIMDSSSRILLQLPLKKSFKHAVKLLRRQVEAPDFLYAVPWYLMIGPKGSGKSTALENAGLNFPVGRPEEEWKETPPDCRWWFFDQGIVLDINGDFVQHATDAHSNERGWRYLLKLLVRFRPRRPIDGVVLNIPVSDLLNDDGTIFSSIELEERAASLHRKLWQLRKSVGLEFPVYVLLTKCDLLPGFQTFACAVGPERRDSMLGWSSPYDREDPFSEAWIAEAFDEVDRSVRSSQIELLAHGEDAKANEQVYLVHNQIAKLRGPLRPFLHAVFKPSAYHKAFSMRGLYFTGADRMERSKATAADAEFSNVFSGPDKKVPHPVFLHDLFEAKIFRERGLARPVMRAMLSRNRAALMAQFTALVFIVGGGFGLWSAQAQIKAATHTLIPYVTSLEQQAAAFQIRHRSDSVSTDRYQNWSAKHEDAARLLHAMKGIETAHVTSYFVPSSWFSDLEGRLARHSAGIFKKIVVDSIPDGLASKAMLITANPRVGQPLGDGRAPAVPDASLSELNKLLIALASLEDIFARYGDFVGKGEMATQDADRVMRYVFGAGIPARFSEHRQFQRVAFAKPLAQMPSLSPFEPSLRARYRRQEADTLEALFSGNEIIRNVRAIAQIVDAVAVTGAKVSQLRRIHNLVTKAHRQLAQNKHRWFGANKIDPRLAFPKTISRISAVRLLGEREADVFRHRTLQSFEQMAGRLRRMRSAVFGHLFVLDSDGGAPKLNDRLVRFEKVLATLLAQSFMTDSAVRSLPITYSSDEQIRWRPETLKEALHLTQEFNHFVKKNVDRVETRVRPLVLNAAIARMETLVNDRIARSRIVSGTRQVVNGALEDTSFRDEIAAFASAMPQLRNILSTFDTLGREDSFVALGQLVGNDAIGLLRRADTTFEAENYYAPREGTFSWWQGDEPAHFSAFNVEDVAGLRQYLAGQRARIKFVAGNFARPLLVFLLNQQLPLSERDRALIVKWRAISEELRKFDQQSVHNSVTALERFIEKDMAELTKENCAQKIGASRVLEKPSDFFLAHRAKLLAQLLRRCKTIL